MEDFVFIILRHVRNADDDVLWRHSVSKILEKYPDAYIKIIDDHSPFEIQNDHDDVLKSDLKPGTAELLPYYYYHKYKWAKRALIIQDSMFLENKLPDSDCELLWWFQPVDPGWNIDDSIRNQISYLKHSRELMELFESRQWVGSLGNTMIISLEFLEHLESKYQFCERLMFTLKSRTDRECLERTIPIMCFNERKDMRFHCNNVNGNLHQWVREKITKKDPSIDFRQYSGQFNFSKYKQIDMTDTCISKVWSNR